MPFGFITADTHLLKADFAWAVAPAETRLGEAHANAANRINGLADGDAPMLAILREGQDQGQAHHAVGLGQNGREASPGRRKGGIAVGVEHPAEPIKHIGRCPQRLTAGDDAVLGIDQQQMLERVLDKMTERLQRFGLRSLDKAPYRLDIVWTRHVPSAFPAADLTLGDTKAFGNGSLLQTGADAPVAKCPADVVVSFVHETFLGCPRVFRTRRTR